MNKESNKILLCILFALFIIMFPLYIYTFKNYLNTFWIIFVAERVISFLYENKIEIFLDDMEKNEEEASKARAYMLLAISIFIILSIAAIIYILFNYFRLFVILAIGQILDKIFDKIRNILKESENAKVS